MEEEATAWVALQDRRDLTEQERVAFEAWKSQSPQNEAMLAEVRAVWGDLDRLSELDDFTMPPEPGVAASDQGARPSPRPWLGRRAMVATIAACVALVFVATASYTLMRPASSIATGTFRTALGEQETVTLADGSTVMLNTQSVVAVDYSKDARLLRLVRGEAHFDVTPDAARPFSVYAGDGVVRAVGTAFTVHLREDKVEVTVAEGRVALLAQIAAPRSAGGGKETVVGEPLAEIGAGDSATFADAAVAQVASLTVPELNRKLSWRRGRLSFAGEPLSDVIREVSRYTDFQIELSDPAIEAIPIGGAFRVGEVEELLLALEEVFGVKVERVSEKHVRLTPAL